MQQTPHFDICFVCRYSFHAHTGQFSCPECGTEYDDQTVVWKLDRYGGGRRFAMYLVVGFLLFVIPGPLTQWAKFMANAPNTVTLALYFVATVLFMILGRELLGRWEEKQRRGWIAFTSSEILLSLKGKPLGIERMTGEEALYRHDHPMERSVFDMNIFPNTSFRVLDRESFQKIYIERIQEVRSQSASREQSSG